MCILGVKGGVRRCLSGAMGVPRDIKVLCMQCENLGVNIVEAMVVVCRIVWVHR